MLAPLPYANLVGSEDPLSLLDSTDWILQTLAGHDLHHLRHLQAIAAQ